MPKLLLDPLLHVNPAKDINAHHSNPPQKHKKFQLVQGGLEMRQLDVGLRMGVVEPDRLRDLAEQIQQGHELVSLDGVRVAEQYLEGGAQPVGLHLAEQSAFLAVDAVQNPRDIMDIFLEFPHLVIRLEKLQVLHLQRDVALPNPLKKLPEQGLRMDIFGSVVGADRVVLQGQFAHSLQQHLVEEEQILDAFGVVEHPLLVLGDVEAVGGRGDAEGGLRRGVVGREVGGDARVQSADQSVQHLLLLAEAGESHPLLEAIFLVDHLPYAGAVVAGEGLDVRLQVEVLPFVVGLVLHVPHPLPLLRPLCVPRGEIRVASGGLRPRRRDILVLTAADPATPRQTQPRRRRKGTGLVQIEPNDPKVLGGGQLPQERSCDGMQLLDAIDGCRFEQSDEEVDPHVEGDGDDRHYHSHFSNTNRISSNLTI